MIRLSGTRGFIFTLRNMLFILEKPLYVKGVETIRGFDHLILPFENAIASLYLESSIQL